MLFNVKQSNRFMFLMFVNFIVMSVILAFLIDGGPLDGAPLWVLLVTSQAMLFLVPCAAIAYVYKDNAGKMRELFPFRKISFTSCVLIVGMCIFVQPLMMTISGVMGLFVENNIDGMVREINQEGGLLLTLFAIAVVPSVCEELAIRGPVLAGYKRGGIIVAVLMNGLFFGLMHLDLQQFLYTAVLGGLFATMVIYTGSLLAPILGHLVINGTQSALLAFSVWVENLEPMEIITEQTGQVAAEEITQLGAVLAMAVMTMFTLPIAAALLYYFIQHNKPRYEAIMAERAADGQKIETIVEDDVPVEVIIERDVAGTEVVSYNDMPPEPVHGEDKRIFTWEVAAIIVIYAVFMLMFFLAPQ